MNVMIRYLILLLALLAPRLAFAAPNPTTPYGDFMRDRKGFSWRQLSRGQGITQLEVTSQTWKDSTWTHRIVIYQPETLQYPDAAAMFLTTERLPFDDETGRMAAEAIGAPFVIVYEVPNQPLWNRSENDLFGYTIGKSIATGDADWSLAFPMAKTAVRAMDAVDVYNATSHYPEARPITRWLQIGLSKRGLAAWLAATDKRVKGLVCIAYNDLNTVAQSQAQLDDWGEVSPRLNADFKDGVKEAMETPRGKELIKTWDPYEFRAQLNKPKLVIDATGGDDWSLRAFDQYAAEMPGTTNLLMVTGTDHTMVDALPQIINASAAWCHWMLGKEPLPQPQLTREGNSWSFQAPGAQEALLNWAWSKNNDFRNAEWEKMPMRKTSSGTFEAAMPDAPAGQGNIAVFALGNWVDGKTALPLGSRVIIDKK